jgi:hypothetical protein
VRGPFVHLNGHPPFPIQTEMDSAIACSDGSPIAAAALDCEREMSFRFFCWHDLCFARRSRRRPQSRSGARRFRTDDSRRDRVRTTPGSARLATASREAARVAYSLAQHFRNIDVILTPMLADAPTIARHFDDRWR